MTNPTTTEPRITTTTPNTDITQKDPTLTTTSPATTTAPEATMSYTQTQSDKKHTTKETRNVVKYEGEYKNTYQYIVIKTYDEYNTLVSSEEEGPYLIDSTYVGKQQKPEVNPNLIEANIDNEILRVTASVTLETETVDGVIKALNAERIANSLTQLGTNGDAQKLATIFAADMAIYDNTTNTSPLYGTLEQLMSRYGISNKGYAINVWRATTNSAE